MADQFYIRVRGRVLGPFDQERLQSLAKRGQFGKMHELSTDGVSWVRASSRLELFTAEIGVASLQEAPVPLASQLLEQSAADDVAVQRGPRSEPADHELWHSADALPETLCKTGVAARPWVLFIGVMGFVYAGLSVAGGLFWLILGASHRLATLVASGLASIIVGAVVIIGAALLVRHASCLGGLHRAREVVVLERALETLKTFWVFAGITLIVLLAFIVLIVVWIIAIGATYDASPVLVGFGARGFPELAIMFLPMPWIARPHGRRPGGLYNGPDRGGERFGLEAMDEPWKEPVDIRSLTRAPVVTLSCLSG